MRTAIKQFRALVAAGNLDEARSTLPAMLSLIDRTARLGSIHDNAAARTKSRLTRALNGGPA
jgi:small subunit ribosomal protein S20